MNAGVEAGQGSVMSTVTLRRSRAWMNEYTWPGIFETGWMASQGTTVSNTTRRMEREAMIFWSSTKAEGGSGEAPIISEPGMIELYSRIVRLPSRTMWENGAPTASATMSESFACQSVSSSPRSPSRKAWWRKRAAATVLPDSRRP